ncbi:NEIL2 Endonuclease, partial [Chordeiles acutipennis]|nr:NEIL2 Endonuclease [Chordeiles acutipennis]
MPEGPSVRKFQLLTTLFVGQVVVKVGGSSRKINVNDLNALRLQDSQVSCTKDEFTGPCSSPHIIPVASSGLVLTDPCPSAVGGPRAGGSSAGGVSGEQSRGVRAEGQVHFPACCCLFLCKCLHSELKKWFRVVFDEFSASPRLVLHFESGGFLVFYNCRMQWCSSPRADPASDILSVEFHRGRALDALRAPEPICYTLLDQRYFSGLGNIIKNEILYLAKIHPLTQGSLLALSDLEHLLDCAVQFSSDWLHNKLHGKGLHPQIYQKEQCPLGHAVMKGTLGPSGGFKRLTWWCPQCQPAVLSEDGDRSPVT